MNVTGILEYSLMWGQCLDPGSLPITTYLDQFKYLFYFFFAYHFTLFALSIYEIDVVGEFTIKEGHFAISNKKNSMLLLKIKSAHYVHRIVQWCHIKKFVAISKSTRYFFFYLITRDNTCMLDGSALNRLTQIK